MGTNERKRVHRRKEYFILAAFFIAVSIGVVVLQGMVLSESLLKASFTDAAGKETEKLSLRIASTPAERAKGLMFEKDLAANEGMLFIFPEERHLSFWMKNTPLSLDMIFIGKDRIVNGVVKNTTPYSEERYSVPEMSQFVVEVNAGRSEALGISKGARIVFHGPLPKAVVDTLGRERELE